MGNMFNLSNTKMCVETPVKVLAEVTEMIGMVQRRYSFIKLLLLIIFYLVVNGVALLGCMLKVSITKQHSGSDEKPDVPVIRLTVESNLNDRKLSEALVLSLNDESFSGDLSPEYFKVYSSSQNSLVTGFNITVQAGTLTITPPPSGLSFAETYHVTVAKNAFSKFSKEMENDFSFDFTIQPPPGSVAASSDPTRFVTKNISMTSNASEGSLIREQSSGKLIVVTRANDGVNNVLSVYRMNPADQTQDLTFGENGFFSYYEDGKNVQINSIKIFSDNSIMLAGTSGRALFLLRLTANGIIDTSFGDQGIGKYPVAGSTAAEINVLRPETVLPTDTSNAMLIGGWYGDGSAQRELFVARVLANGSLDVNFGVNGFFVDESYTRSEVFDLWIDSGTSAVYFVAREFIHQTSNKLVISRLNAIGTLDTTYGSSGKVTKTIVYWISRAKFQNDGKVVALYQRPTTNPYGFEVWRYNLDGTTDAGFGTTGRYIRSGYSSSCAFWGNENRNYCTLDGLVITSSGDIFVSGGAFSTATDFRRFILKLNSSGALDTAFSTDGYADISLGNIAATDKHDYVADIVVSSSSKIYLIGTDMNGGDGFSSYFEDAPQGSAFIMEYDSSGNLNLAWGTDGSLELKLGRSKDDLQSIVSLADGSYILAGLSNGTVTVYKTDSQFQAQNSFGTDGVASFSLGGHFPNNPQVKNIMEDSEGRILLVVQQIEGAGTTVVKVLRMLANGQLDTDFATAGIYTINYTSFTTSYVAAKIYPDNFLNIATAVDDDGVYSCNITQLDTTGNPNNAFDGDGILGQSSSNGYCRATFDSGNGIYLLSEDGINASLKKYSKSGILDIGFDVANQLSNMSLTMGVSAARLWSDSNTDLLLFKDGVLNKYSPLGIPEAAFNNQIPDLSYLASVLRVSENRYMLIRQLNDPNLSRERAFVSMINATNGSVYYSGQFVDRFDNVISCLPMSDQIMRCFGTSNGDFAVAEFWQ
ncbi:MAG: hypothetical protein B7Y39_06390 [Bdellovibrio sp. 28-41-41]|nr:MAG: hypothetical protein B7Y39_06390 [Bdellovibrio sp. 28-41-41]